MLVLLPPPLRNVGAPSAADECALEQPLPVRTVEYAAACADAACAYATADNNPADKTFI